MHGESLGPDGHVNQGNILDIIILTMPHLFFYRSGTYICTFIAAKVPILEGKAALGGGFTVSCYMKRLRVCLSVYVSVCVSVCA